MNDEISNSLREQMAERSKIFIDPFLTGGGSSDNPLGICPLCNAHLVQYNNTEKICPKGCGKWSILEPVKKERKKGYRDKGTNKQFIISQQRQTKKPAHVEEAERIFGGEVTSFEETEYSSEDFHS